MKEFSIPMAIVDYIPVILFALSTSLLAKDLKHKMNKITKYMLYIGIFLVTVAGFLKATYKLLYALNIGDFTFLSSQFFPNQAIGFLLVGIATLLALSNKNKEAFVIPTMGLVAIMIIGVCAMDAGLCFIASKMKKKNALICFILSFFLILMMGYLSSKDFDKAYMNWLAQAVNILGQLLLYIGVKILDKAGLKNY